MSTPAHSIISEKPAPTDAPLLEAIRQRWSPRAFDPRPIEDEKIRTLFEAGRWAASSYNRQPWHFIIANRDDSDTFQTMLGVLNEWNRGWAQHAGLVGFTVAKMTTDDGDPNAYAEHDTGMALAHVALQATALDLQMHMMAGFSKDRARELYNIPDGYKPLTAFAIGYIGTMDHLSEKMQQREQSERQREPLAKLVFTNDWNESAEVVQE